MQSGPCPWLEGRDDVDWPIPVTVIAGGEGRGAREREGAMAHLLVCLGAREDGRRSSSALDRARLGGAAWQGEDAPAKEGSGARGKPGGAEGRPDAAQAAGGRCCAVSGHAGG